MALFLGLGVWTVIQVVHLSWLTIAALVAYFAFFRVTKVCLLIALPQASLTRLGCVTPGTLLVIEQRMCGGFDHLRLSRLGVTLD
jgi:hypothetical protein